MRRSSWRRPFLLLAIAAAIATLAPVIQRPGALFNDVASVSDNLLTTADCFGDALRHVQSGTATSSATGTTTVTIEAVDPSRAFLLFSSRHALNRPVGSAIRGRLASATTVEFTRATNETSTMSIAWSVVEYPCGLSVQRGEVAQTATTVDVPVTPVASLSQAFLTWSKTPTDIDNEWGADDDVVGELTSTSNVQFRAGAATATHTISWQLVEFTRGGDVDVQRGTGSLTGGALTTTATLSTPVDPATTFILVDARSTGSGPDIGARMVEARLTGPTTIEITRGAAGDADDMVDITWQAVELTDGSSVQHHTTSFAAASGQVTETISGVDTSRATAFGTVQKGSGQNSGQTAFVADDAPGAASATLELTATTRARVTRAHTTAASTVSWVVVEWGSAANLQAAFGSVQSGTATSAGNGTVTATIAPVDTARAFLLFSAHHSGNRPPASTIRGRLLDSTTVEFTRVTDEVSTITIQWSVVEYLRGVRVQRGEAAQSATVVDVPITAVASTEQAFVTWSKTPAAADQAWGADDPVATVLTSTTNLQLRASGSNGLHTVSWQVVEFTHPDDIEVQRGTTTLGGSALSVAAALNEPVDLSRSFVLADVSSASADADVGARMVRARLTDGSTVTIDRLISGSPDTIDEISWQVVELLEGSRVQRGAADFAAGIASRTVALAPFDSAKSVGFGSFQHGSGQSAGASAEALDDVVGSASATVSVAANQVTLQRGSTAAAADIGFFVVEWGGPPWMAGGYGYRRPITVDTSTAATASGYSLALDLDHATLVADGRARADGADVRIGYWNGSAWTELDRVLDSDSTWNAADTRLWFRSQAATAANTGTIGYYVYHGQPAAGAAPSNPANVYLFEESFESGSLEPRWLVAPASWYDSAWAYRKPITIDNVRVSGTHENFPVLISITDADLRDKAKDDGSDLLFTAYDGITEVDFEIERFNGATGELVAWVKTTVTVWLDVPVYVYYGNPASTNQENPAGLWGSGYAGVWHLNDNPAGTAPQAEDSAPAARHGTTAGAMTSGQSVAGRGANGYNLDGANDSVGLGAWDVSGSAITVSGWFRADTFGVDPQLVARATSTATADAYWQLFVDDTSTTTGNLRWRVNAGGTTTDVTGGAVVPGTWYYAAATYDGATLRLYRNGAQVASVAKTGSLRTGTAPTWIGNNPTAGGRPLDGVVDEVKVATVARSSQWLLTEYNNLSSPSTFHFVGAEEPYVEVFTIESDHVHGGSWALKVMPSTGTDRWIAPLLGAANTDVAVEAWWRLSHVTGMDVAQGFRNNGFGTNSQYETTFSSAGWDVSKTISGTWSQLAAPPAGQDPQPDTWTRITTEHVGTDMRVRRNGTQITPASGWTAVGSELTSGTVSFRVREIAPGQAWWVDDIRVRRLVDPEPIVHLGSVERSS